VSFVEALAERLPKYEIASEHEHSNCVLIAHKKVCITTSTAMDISVLFLG